MSPQQFSGRPEPRLEITVVFGVAATRAYHDGERDEEVLNKIGRIKTFKFTTLEGLNAFLLGVDEATGYLDTHFVED